jgi:hypothetical protein
MYYKIIYKDSARILFEVPGLARVIKGVLGQEVPITNLRPGVGTRATLLTG